jgi:predicted outer membrane lipoprotein
MIWQKIAIGLGHGTRSALVNNLSAFGFSVMVTATFGVLSARLGSPGTVEIFLFAAGAVAGVTLLDGISSKGFKRQIRGETSDVVALGAGLGFVSVGAAIGSAALLAEIVDGGSAWLLGSFLASCAYLLLNGFEMSLAKVLQEDRQADTEKEEA